VRFLFLLKGGTGRAERVDICDNGRGDFRLSIGSCQWFKVAMLVGLEVVIAYVGVVAAVLRLCRQVREVQLRRKR
jgi:hypothetical protein